MECPRKYLYSIVYGYAPLRESIHLTFGLLLHKAREVYEHSRVKGRDHDTALDDTVSYLLCATWDRVRGRPWQSDMPEKNRWTLLRTAVWYLDQFGQKDPVETLILANGKPAIELSFKVDLNIKSVTGEPYTLAGHIDKVGVFNDNAYILDIKSTKTTLSERYFDDFNPHNQFSGYMFAGKVILPEPIAGLIVDAAQVAVTFSRFERKELSFPVGALEEWHHDVRWWLHQNETYVARQYWPMNRKSCGNYGGCAFRAICSKSPLVREQWLEATFAIRQWDPTINRGDI